MSIQVIFGRLFVNPESGRARLRSIASISALIILSCSVIFLGAVNIEPFFPAKGFFLAAAANTFFGFCVPIDIDILTGAVGADGAGESLFPVGASFCASFSSGDSAVVVAVGGDAGFASAFFEPSPRFNFIFSPSFLCNNLASGSGSVVVLPASAVCWARLIWS